MKKSESLPWDNYRAMQKRLHELRVRVRQSRRFEGYTDIRFGDVSFRWYSNWSTQHNGPPAFARIGVYRKGDRYAIYATASFHECVPWINTENGLVEDPYWLTFGRDRLAEVAELIALEKAFPECAKIRGGRR